MTQNLGSPEEPLEMHGEQWQLEVRTTDPANPSPDERWIRSDLNGGDKIATLRCGDGTDIPIFPTGTATDTVREARRYQVNGSLGYAPIAPESEAAFTARRVQHAGQVHAYHDRMEPGSALLDSAIAHWPTDEGSGSTVADAEGTNDLTLNGPTWQTGAGTNDTYTNYDGSGDVSDGSEAPVTGSQNRTLVAWINPDSVSDRQVVADWGANNNDGERWTFHATVDNQDPRIEVAGGGFTSSLTVSSDQWQLLACILDTSQSDEHIIYLDGATDQGTTGISIDTQSDNPIRVGNTVTYSTSRYFDGGIDEMFITNDALSISQLDDYRNDTKSRYGL